MGHRQISRTVSESMQTYDAVTGISSMATKRLLVALGEACELACGVAVRFESIGGVDAAKRVREGESFDLVVLAEDVIDDLATAGYVIAATRRPVADSIVAIAVHADAERPDIASEASLRSAVMSAARIGYSTGPSGTALMKLFTRWGLHETLRDRLVQAQSGEPVAALLATGKAEIGFQQFSELKNEEGITVLGPMPQGLEVVTTFVGAVGTGSARQTGARTALEFMASSAADEIRQQHGMSGPMPGRFPDSTLPEKYQ